MTLKQRIMKIKVFILTCLFLGVGLTQLFAQNINSSGTYTLQWKFTATYWTPVYCGEQLIDELSGGEIVIHLVVHRNEGLRVWRTDQIRGEVTSTKEPYEVYQIVEMDKNVFIDNNFSTVTWKYNLKGNLGNHYIGTLSYDYFTGEIMVGPTKCN